MKVFLEKCIFEERESYKVTRVEKCCNELTHNPIIDFYACDDFRNSEDEFGVGMVQIDTYPEPWEDFYSTDYTYFKLTFCPFCGEKIELVVERTIDKSDEYIKLGNKTSELRKKINKCDSIKKKDLLEKDWRVLYDQLNEFYEHGSIRESDEEEDFNF